MTAWVLMKIIIYSDIIYLTNKHYSMYFFFLHNWNTRCLGYVYRTCRSWWSIIEYVFVDVVVVVRVRVGLQQQQQE